MFFTRRRVSSVPNTQPANDQDQYRLLEGGEFASHVQAQREALGSASSRGTLAPPFLHADGDTPAAARLAEYICKKRSEVDLADVAAFYPRVYLQCRDPAVIRDQPPPGAQHAAYPAVDVPWKGAVPNVRFHTWTISHQERCVSCRFSDKGDDLVLVSQDSVVLIHSTDCWKPRQAEEELPQLSGQATSSARETQGTGSEGSNSRNSSWLGLGHSPDADDANLFASSGSESRGLSDDDTSRGSRPRERTTSLVASGRLQNVGFSLLDVCWAADGASVAVCGWDSAVVICRRSRGDPNAIATTRVEVQAGGELESEFRGSCVFSIAAVSPTLYVLGTNSSRAIVVDVTRSRSSVVHEVPHIDDVNAVAALRGGAPCFLSGSDDGLIKLSDMRSPNARTVFSGHAGGLTSLDTCPLEVGAVAPYFVSNAKDQTAKVWDLRNGLALASVHQEKEVHRQTAMNMLHWDYRYGNGPPPACSLRPDRSLLTLNGSHTTAITLCRARFSPSGRHVVCGGAEGTFTVYSLRDSAATVVRAHNSVVRDVAWHPTLPLIATASWDGRCSLYCANDWTSHPAATVPAAPTAQDLNSPVPTSEGGKRRITLGDFFITRCNQDEEEL